MPIGWLYGKIADIRNGLYDRGTLRSYLLGARAISIGNITTGGTGKTPLVARIAEILTERGEKICILTRGYGRKDAGRRVVVSNWDEVLADAETGGDEPVELARRLLGKAVVIADADRVGAAAWAKEHFGATAFVLDDGFQHRRAMRDLDIVCVDATDPFGGRKMLPFGRLREPLENLRRADVIVVTRADLVKGTEALEEELAELNPQAPIFTASTRIVRLTRLEDFLLRERSGTPVLDLNDLRSASLESEMRLMAFCALGNPNNFFRQVMLLFEDAEQTDEFDLLEKKDFPDHHVFRQNDITEVERQAREKRIDAMLTTAKDAVKLKDLEFTIPCFVVEAETVIENEEEFRSLL